MSFTSWLGVEVTGYPEHMTISASVNLPVPTEASTQPTQSDTPHANAPSSDGNTPSSSENDPSNEARATRARQLEYYAKARRQIESDLQNLRDHTEYRAQQEMTEARAKLAEGRTLALRERYEVLEQQMEDHLREVREAAEFQARDQMRRRNYSVLDGILYYLNGFDY